MVPTVLYPSNDTDDQLSTYAESSIWQHARYHEHLLLRLGALDYAPAQLRESLARLEHLQLCSNDCQTSDRVSHDGNGIQSHLGQPTASGSSSRSASARRSSSSSAPPPRKPPGLLARAVKKGKGKGKARLGDEQVPDYKCSYSKEDRALQGARIETEEIARSVRRPSTLSPYMTPVANERLRLKPTKRYHTASRSGTFGQRARRYPERA